MLKSTNGSKESTGKMSITGSTISVTSVTNVHICRRKQHILNPPNSPNPQIGSVSSCHSSENWNRRWCQNWNTRATRPTLTTTQRTTWTKFLASVKGSRESLMTFDHFISKETEEDCVVKSSFCENLWIFQKSQLRMSKGSLHKCYFQLSYFSVGIFLQVQQMYFYKIRKHISECSADIFLQNFLLYDLCSKTKESQVWAIKTLNKWYQLFISFETLNIGINLKSIAFLKMVKKECIYSLQSTKAACICFLPPSFLFYI